ncbi:MAG: LuxR C-terminal-related transcriptional regulator [Tannerella sp.]|jgi:DNA-binding CsgD family transcriptional regulator|nr:LuxR C-terminal-related transcriptional regulator [Tannerella sp.]
MLSLQRQNYLVHSIAAILKYHYFDAMNEWLLEYERALSQQVFDETDRNYNLPETQHKPLLKQLAKVSNSVITVFDLCVRRHVFISPNFFDLFGANTDIEGMEGKIHADDLQALTQHAITAFQYVFSNKETMHNYKFIADYRVCNAAGKYVRVIEQQSVLEQDKAGNVRLALSVLDLSPDQNTWKPLKCGVFSKSDNHLFPIRSLSEKNSAGLSPREIEILQLVKEGLLSKEISERLCISVHTVNTHRQRILEKLDADNAMEAIKYASALGLLS